MKRKDNSSDSEVSQ